MILLDAVIFRNKVFTLTMMQTAHHLYVKSPVEALIQPLLLVRLQGQQISDTIIIHSSPTTSTNRIIFLQTFCIIITMCIHCLVPFFLCVKFILFYVARARVCVQT